MNWNFERWRTRDRLIDYDFNIIPPAPHSAGLSMIYPWEDISLKQLDKQIFTLAQQHGYDGTIDSFWERFNGGGILFGTLDTFPVPGQFNNLYFDVTTKILYYFTTAGYDIDEETIARVGGAIVGKSRIDMINLLYLPIKALCIEDTNS